MINKCVCKTSSGKCSLATSEMDGKVTNLGSLEYDHEGYCMVMETEAPIEYCYKYNDALQFETLRRGDCE